MRILLALLAVLALAPAGLAQHVTDKGQGLVSVNAENASLGALVQELRALVPMDALLIDPAIAGTPVTVSIEDTPGVETLMEVLGASKQNFAVLGGGKIPLRVYIGERTFALANRPAAEGFVGAVVAASGTQGDEGDRKPGALQERLAQEQASLEREANEEAARQREAEAVPLVVTNDPKVPGGYTMVGESVVYHDPNFVPLKNRPALRNKRLAIDVSKIP